MEESGIGYPTAEELEAMAALMACPLADPGDGCDRCGILRDCLGNYNALAAGRRTFAAWKDRQHRLWTDPRFANRFANKLANTPQHRESYQL